MQAITFHLFSTARPASDGTDYFYYLEIFVAFCPPKTFQNGSLCLECGSSELSLCPSHKDLKSEWRSTRAPKQNPTATGRILCVSTRECHVFAISTCS
jgi:hypothetical protein